MILSGSNEKEKHFLSNMFLLKKNKTVGGF